VLGEGASDAVAFGPDMPSPPVGHAPVVGGLAVRPALAISGYVRARLAGRAALAVAGGLLARAHGASARAVDRVAMSVRPQRLVPGRVGRRAAHDRSRGGCMSTRAAEEDVALVANA
jgi:hypothetical protein